ncbi:DNA mismatch repair protein MutS [Alphaproteobacteria bacterium]|nr:DNA mismatch repair protein MutS [Alphaproteobacteria bacterium]GHS97173.1 DNA mismatch repair protein MutS [Alphaproteobacteria bacterium]
MAKLTDEDKALWKQITKKTRPLIHKTHVFPSAPPKSKGAARPTLAHLMQEDVQRQKLSSSYGLEALPQSKARTIRCDATFDLHGLTRAEAEVALPRFLYKSQLLGHVWVKIITGKSGLFSQEIFVLLKENAAFVSGTLFARANDGGTGALYVRIRKSV